jgi:hypothetical protein
MSGWLPFAFLAIGMNLMVVLWLSYGQLCAIRIALEAANRKTLP